MPSKAWRQNAFGVSSAAYWWVRLAAEDQRPGLHVLDPWLPVWPHTFRGRLYLTAEGRAFAKTLLAFLWWVVLFGPPLSWHKCGGGLVYTWIGLEVRLRDWTLGVSASRAGWIDGWFTRTAEAKAIDPGELREALGRLVFVYGALQFYGPFLAPLFAFLPLHRPGRKKRLPAYALVALRW